MPDSLDDMVEPDKLLAPPENPATQMAGKVRHGLGELTGVNDAYKAMTGQMSETEQQDFAAQAAMGLLPMGKIPAAFIGAVGIKNLAKGGNRGPALSLRLAEEMEAKGFDRKQIWDATWDGAGGVFKDVDGKWRYEISDRGLKVQEGIGYTGLRGGPIEHPELERAYPKVPFTSEVTVDPMLLVRRGKYERNENEIPNITAKGPTLGDTRSTAGHELQHLISDIEDFAAGGSFAEMMDIGLSTIPKGNLSPSLKKKAEQAAFEAYRLHSGEVEARNVQKRMDMPAMARKNIPPWETQDVADKDKIVKKFPREDSAPPYIEVIKKYGLAGTMMLPAATANLIREKIVPVDHDPFAQEQARAD